MARRRVVEPPRTRAGWPPELSSRLHPFWRDHAAVVARYAEHLTPGQLTSTAGRNLHQTVITAWSLAHGFTTPEGQADWHALRSAGVLMSRG